MWAEWMKDFDLSVTPEDIERYEEMQRIKRGKPIKKKNQPKIIGSIKKTHKKSWFKKFNLNSYEANNILSKNPLWKCETNSHSIIPHDHYEDVVVLQILLCGHNEAIAEIVFKEDL